MATKLNGKQLMTVAPVLPMTYEAVAYLSVPFVRLSLTLRRTAAVHSQHARCQHYNGKHGTTDVQRHGENVYVK